MKPEVEITYLPDGSLDYINLRDKVAMAVLPSIFSDNPNGDIKKNIKLSFDYADKFMEIRDET